MLTTLLSHQWNDSRRSSVFGKSIAINIILGFFIAYFLLGFLVLGFFMCNIYVVKSLVISTIASAVRFNNYLKTLFVKFNKIAGRIAVFAILAAFLLIGLNSNRLVISEAIFVFAVSVFTGIGLLASFTKVYQTFYFWKQYTGGQKLGRVIEIIFLTIFLIIAIFINLRILKLYFR